MQDTSTSVMLLAKMGGVALKRTEQSSPPEEPSGVTVSASVRSTPTKMSWLSPPEISMVLTWGSPAPSKANEKSASSSSVAD
jgi:hypothetical protein